jgi:hypothetical protein
MQGERESDDDDDDDPVDFLIIVSISKENWVMSCFLKYFHPLFFCLKLLKNMTDLDIKYSELLQLLTHLVA